MKQFVVTETVDNFVTGLAIFNNEIEADERFRTLVSEYYGNDSWEANEASNNIIKNRLLLERDYTVQIIEHTVIG